MTCSNCARHVQEALSAVPGVASARIHLESGRADVQFQAGHPGSAEPLIAAVQAAGYTAQTLPGPGDAGLDSPPPGSNPWHSALWLGGPVLLIQMIAEWGLGLGMNRSYHIAAFLLSLPVQVWVGGRFYQGAWRQLRVGQSNMDTLVSLGSTAAFGFSVWGLFQGFHGHLYFMEAVGILTLISLGHWLESRMSARAGASLQALMRLAPEQARRREHDGTERDVPVAELQPGHQIVLRPGDRIPVDAEVTDGFSHVEEAMLTGEPVPVEKTPGTLLYAGTINQSGRLVAAVRATGANTALSHIIAAVERAQTSRAQIQRLADKVSSVFVPVVVAVAVLTALFWALDYERASAIHAQLRPWLWSAHLPESPAAAAWVMFASVLIVACPCAMGLATPAALMAGVNAAARRGILIRDALALEKSGRVNTIIFDKTGTLTTGHPEVLGAWPEPTLAPSLATLVSSLTRGSQHPLSRALADWAAPSGASGPIPHGWRELRGSGVEARGSSQDGVAGWHRLGSADWLRSQDVSLDGAASFASEWASRGASVLYLAHNQRLLAAFALRDALKPGAREMVERLRARGLQVGLLSGDQPAAALVLGNELGIAPQEIAAGVRPEDKANVIRQRQQLGGKVAFVGDGLNDGPALAQADLGIAVTRATDVAREAADVLLLQGDLAAIPAALDLAQATLQVIHQNLFWAFFYNAAFIPLAALGFLSPMLSAVAMAASDLIVLGNALRLRRR